MKPADPMLGTRIGDYTVEERIGVGGMGIVYRAVQPLIGKQVAIKILSPHMASHPEAVHRLLAEARMVSTIQHSGIIDIFGFGQLPDGRQYMVMEYLQGTPLDAYLAQHQRLEPAEVFSILEEVLAALGAAHAAGVVHRDLKPSNIFLVQQPDGTRYIKLLDFGIAKAEALSSDTPHTATGQMLGTPQYMAPEQVRSEPVSPRTDLYALGVLAFKMITGQLPFSGDRLEMLFAHVNLAPPAPSQLTPGLPPGVDELILSLMAKRPEQRPASADEVRRAMARLRTAPFMEVTVPLGPTPLLAPPRRRTWRWTVGAGLLLAAVGGLAGVLHTRADEARPAPKLPAPPPPIIPPAVEPGPPPPVEAAEKHPLEPPKIQPGPQARLHRPKPRPKPGAEQLARYTRLKRTYEARVESGAERNLKAERQLESARELATQASETQDRQEARELVEQAQELLDDWARDYQK